MIDPKLELKMITSFDPSIRIFIRAVTEVKAIEQSFAQEINVGVD